MDELLSLHRVNADRFTLLVEEVGTNWDAPTPCIDWSVRELVNHLTAEQLWVPELLAGRTIAEVGDKFAGDVLGDDPVATWRAAIAAAVAAFADETARGRTVELSVGTRAAHEYLDEMVTDLAIHGWDLAIALHVDETIDPLTVDRLLIEWTGRASELPHPLFGEPLPSEPTDDPQTKLLAIFGRRA
ncbi:TIGR03086 family metal-binding protein [Pengzhenrongella frigida]|uniref:TIGR03086 family protein n=1 Tax=Pengzhenrongella frigida TaxID=1259133 RepID=A0A4Q5MXD9_9MICO|nr:TIGR03086 family metal-binding protein [Cellulomonas sp. HLT2-17]RYV49603.1 TIGR03086 family protein [Cellulomonas sp. HLT2-17]